MNSGLLSTIARLGGVGGLRILDGGNRFNAYTVARAASGRQDILNRITVSRAFTCYQVLSLLESTPATPSPFVVLDLLNTFYDESVQAGERIRLLRACIAHLERLVAPAEFHSSGMLRNNTEVAGGLVSVHPPSVPSQTAIELLELLQASAADTFVVQAAPLAPEPMRLF